MYKNEIQILFSAKLAFDNFFKNVFPSGQFKK